MSNERMIESQWFKDHDGDEIQISSTIGNTIIAIRAIRGNEYETSVEFKVEELKEILKAIDRHQEILKGGVVEK